MSRQAITRLPLAALALVLLLGGPAAAFATPPRTGAARPATAPASAAPHLAALWRWWAGLWPSSLTTVRGGEGSGIDPDGKPATAGALPGYSIVTGDEGSAVDPDGKR